MRPLAAIRAEKVGRIISRHVIEGQRVLDVGCGDLRIGKAIQKASHAQVAGIDIANHNQTDLPFTPFDGCCFPFENDSFDVVLFSFVLHHSRHQEDLLREACRVGKQYIILLEDLYTSQFTLLMTKAHDICVNKLIYPTMPCPLTFRTRDGWKAVFDSMGLRLTAEERIASLPISLQNQVLFKLEKT